MSQQQRPLGPLMPVDTRLFWDSLPEERQYGVRATVIVAVLFILFMLLYVITPMPEMRADQLDEVPERLAQLVMERKQEPPPPPPEPEPEEEPQEEEPEPEPEPEAEREPEPPPEKVEQARQKARKELKVFEDSLAGLRQAAPVVNPGLRRGGTEAAKIDTSRNLITSRAGSGSGGIRVGEVSSSGGGGGTLAEGQVAQVTSDIAEKAAPQRTADGKSRRTEEQIRQSFDRYAGRFNAAYQRALRSNPALQGTVVFTLTIEPDGTVSDVSIKSSELNDEELERRMVLVVRTMDFGALQVEPWSGDYALNFFPG